MTVGKTYVGYTIHNHLYAIHVLRQTLKHKRPRPVPHHLVWGMDLTGKTDNQGRQHAILGLVEHRSRACLSLQALRDKTAVTLLRCLLDLVDYFGKQPNQYLDGLTPAEVWRGKTDCNRQSHQVYWFEAWEGLLRGFYLPPQ
jgi:hypothetical protein